MCSLIFQCKIDKMILFHAVVKFVEKCSGGTALRKHLGVYVSSRQKKYKVQNFQEIIIEILRKLSVFKLHRY